MVLFDLTENIFDIKPINLLTPPKERFLGFRSMFDRLNMIIKYDNEQAAKKQEKLNLQNKYLGQHETGQINIWHNPTMDFFEVKGRILQKDTNQTPKVSISYTELLDSWIPFDFVQKGSRRISFDFILDKINNSYIDDLIKTTYSDSEKGSTVSDRQTANLQAVESAASIDSGLLVKEVI